MIRLVNRRTISVLFGCSISTVKRLEKEGRLTPLRATATSHPKYDLEEVAGVYLVRYSAREQREAAREVEAAKTSHRELYLRFGDCVGLPPDEFDRHVDQHL